MLINYWSVSKTAENDHSRPRQRPRPRVPRPKPRPQNSGLERSGDQDHGLEDYIFDYWHVDIISCMQAWRRRRLTNSRSTISFVRQNESITGTMWHDMIWQCDITMYVIITRRVQNDDHWDARDAEHAAHISTEHWASRDKHTWQVSK